MGKKTKITVSTGKLQNEYILEDFKKDAITVGRGRDNDIVVRGAKVSNNHGCFFKENGKWYYQDLNSTNGTICNGQKIVKAELTENAKFVLDSSVVDDSVVINVSVGDFDSVVSIGDSAVEKDSNKSKTNNTADKKFKGIIIGLGAAISVVLITIVIILFWKKDDTSGGGGASVSGLSKYGKVGIIIDESVLSYDESFGIYYIPDEFSGFTGTIDGNESDLKEIKFKIVDSNDVELDSGQIEQSEGAWKLEAPGMILGKNTLKISAVNNANVEETTELVFYNNDEKYLDGITIDTEDKDGDGLIGYIEMTIGTDDNNPDTDGDGLEDGIEYAITNTSPVKYDSENDGICDVDRDSDSDGLTNKEEINIETDPGAADTDGDGLLDGEEVNSYKTDPLKVDTDNDNARDQWEVDNGTDPLVKEESFKIDISSFAENSAVAAEAIGNYEGNPEDIIVEPVVDNILLDSSMSGYIGCAYKVEYPNTGNATIDLNMTIDDSKSYNSEDISIYELNEEEQILEKIPTTVSGNKATAVISHSATYILLNNTEVNSVISNDIMTQAEIDDLVIKTAFVIDYSQSMDDNDPDYSRLRIVKEYLKNMDNGRNYASIIKFAGYATVMIHMTSDIGLCEEEIGNIINNDGGGGCESDNEAGTNGSDGIRKAIDEFDSEDDSHKSIIFLTDGNDTTRSYDYDELIEEAKEKGIVIFTIGLGSADEELLKKIAEGTNGKYYKASEIDEDTEGFYTLEESFSDIQQQNEEFNMDSNEDGINDYYTRLICEGKLRTGTGVNPFEGLSFEDVNSKADYDDDHLLNGQEIMVYEKDGRIYLRFFSSPIKADTDGDGFYDDKDNRALLWDVGNRDLAIFASLSYCDATGHMGGMYSKSQLDDEDSFYKYSSLCESLCEDTEKYDDSGIYKNWVITDYVNEKNTLGLDYFSMTVYKCQDNVVLSYRGTGAMGFGEGTEPGEWIDNIIGYGIFNYHTEEDNAQKYARKVARQYPDCNIYITGHSLGGYLAQIGAAEMINHTNVKPARVVYFDGMGLNFDLGWMKKFFPLIKVTQLIGRFLHIDDTEALKNYYNGIQDAEYANLVLFYVYGDIVSALGNHYGFTVGFTPEQDQIDWIVEKHKKSMDEDEKLQFLKCISCFSVGNALMYYNTYSLKFGINSLMGYLELTHGRPALYYNITQGRRGTGSEP